jgi:hypothetical protein
MATKTAGTCTAVALLAAALLVLAAAIQIAAARREEPFVTAIVTRKGAEIINVDGRCSANGHVFRTFDGLRRDADGACVMRTGGGLTCEAAASGPATRNVRRDVHDRCLVEFRPGASAAEMAAFEGRMIDIVVEGSRAYRAMRAEHDAKVVAVARHRAAMQVAVSEASAAESVAAAEVARAPPGYAADTGPLPGGDVTARFQCPLRCRNDGTRFTGDWFASPSGSHGYCKCMRPKSSPQPGVAMSGPSTAGYAAEASSAKDGREAWRAFDRSPYTWWESSGTRLAGQFVGLRVPAPVTPAFYTLSPRADSRYALINVNPNGWTLAGWPSDGSPPVTVDTRTGIAWSTADPQRFEVAGTATPCTVFVLYVHGVGNPGTRDHSAACLGELVVYAAGA